MNWFVRLNQAVDRWLTAPEANAAGRMGLYRILYALFYLTYLPALHTPQLAYIPAGEWRPVLSLLWLEATPPLAVMQAVQVGLVLGLGLLLVGWQVRGATLLVLLTGLFIVSVRFSFGKVDHANTFLMVYIPAMMLFYNWGRTYSLDALLRQRRGLSVPDVNESSWQYGWPIKVVLWLLCILFGTGGLLKLMDAWLVDFEMIPKLMFGYNIQPQPNPLNPLIATTPLLYLPLHFMALGFETLFPMAVINHTWRRFFVSSAILFHLFILLFMQINFAAMVITYAIFINWQWVYARMGQPGQRLEAVFARQRGTLLITGSLSAAILLTVVWHGLVSAFRVEMWGDVPAYMNIYWLIAVPLALYGVVASGLKLVRGLLDTLRRRPAPADALNHAATK